MREKQLLAEVLTYVPQMSLRDWFAGQAMVAAIGATRPWYTDGKLVEEPEQYAVIAYSVADAMLEARTK